MCIRDRYYAAVNCTSLKKSYIRFIEQVLELCKNEYKQLNVVRTGRKTTGLPDGSPKLRICCGEECLFLSLAGGRNSASSNSCGGSGTSSSVRK